MKVTKSGLYNLISSNQINLNYFLQDIFFDNEEFKRLVVTIENVEISRGYLEDFQILSLVKTQYLTYTNVYDLLSLELLQSYVKNIRFNDDYIEIYIRKKG